MRVFVTKPFARFKRRERIRDETIWAVVGELEAGAFDADLGGGLYKQRIPRQGKGKSGGYRAMIAFKHGNLLVFLTGLAKNEKSNLSPNELNVLKRFARHVLELTASEIEALRVENEWEQLVDEKA